MCGRYFMGDDDKAEELQQIIDILNRKPSSNTSALKTSGEVFPSDTVPVIANSKALKPTPFAMEWGYTTPDGNRLINARSETASEKPTFKDGMAQRRCIIPASYYFEWEKTGRAKIKHAIGSTAENMIYMAGIYRLEQGTPTFSILTRPPAPSIEFIHNRMPVILPKSMLRDWLNTKYKAEDILQYACLDVDHRIA